MVTAKKPPAKAPAAAAKKPGTALAKWDEKLAALAKRAKKAEASVATGSFISIKGGIMSFAGNVVPGNKLEAVVVDSILENALYEGDYDPNNLASPVCFAFGRDEDEMVPHPNVVKAGTAQSETCASCPHNEWGSAEKGKGKACKNVRRLSLITADTLDNGAQGVTDAHEAYVKVPVTSVKGWAGYVNSLEATGKPPLAFVTEIGLIPDTVSQFKLTFRALESIDDGDLIGALLDKNEAGAEAIMFPYQANEAREAPAKKAPAKARIPIKGVAPKLPPTGKGKAAPAATGRRKF